MNAFPTSDMLPIVLTVILKGLVVVPLAPTEVTECRHHCLTPYVPPGHGPLELRSVPFCVLQSLVERKNAVLIPLLGTTVFRVKT